MANARLSDMAGDLLQAVIDEYGDRGLDAPARQFTTTGPVALDCSTLAVTLSRVYSGMASVGPSDGSIRPGTMTLVAELQVIVARCIPTFDDTTQPPTVPTTDELTASSVALMGDAAAVVEAVRQRVLAGGLFEPCMDVGMGDLTPLDNSGGLGGWGQVVRVQV